MVLVCLIVTWLLLTASDCGSLKLSFCFAIAAHIQMRLSCMLVLRQCRCSSKFGVPAREIQSLQDRDIGTSRLIANTQLNNPIA
jgi:hypothetical protein